MPKFKVGDKVKPPKKSSNIDIKKFYEEAEGYDKPYFVVHIAYDETIIGIKSEDNKPCIHHDSFHEDDLELYNPQEEEIKVGDEVELITLDHSEEESENWIVRESKKPKVGDRFIVTHLDKYTPWIDVDGLEYAHPIGKFKKVTKNQTNMKYKQYVAVTGDLVLLEAFAKKSVELGRKAFKDLNEMFSDDLEGRTHLKFYESGEFNLLDEHTATSNPHLYFRLPEDWNEALKAVAEKAQPPEVVPVVGNWYTCINYGEGFKGAGWKEEYVFKATSIRDGGNRNEGGKYIAMGALNGSGVYSRWLREATPEEIESASQVVIGKYSSVISEGGVAFGCLYLNKADLLTFSKVLESTSNLQIEGVKITPDMVDKLLKQIQ